jgi:hypothetical protein
MDLPVSRNVSAMFIFKSLFVSIDVKREKLILCHIHEAAREGDDSCA